MTTSFFRVLCTGVMVIKLRNNIRFRLQELNLPSKIALVGRGILIFVTRRGIVNASFRSLSKLDVGFF